MQNSKVSKLKKYKKLFVEKFFLNEYKLSYEYYNKFFEIREKDNKIYKKWQEQIKNDYENLDNIDEKYLLHRANVARCQKQNFLLFNYALLTLIKNPKCSKIFYYLAKDEYENESLERAKILINSALQNDSDNHSYLYLHAMCIAMQLYDKNIDKISKNKLTKTFIKELNKAIELAPNVVDYYLAFARYYSFDKKDFQKAIEYYNKAIEYDPDNSWFYSDRAECYKEIGDIQKAVEDYLKSIKLDPTDHFTYRDLGYLYIDNGNPDKFIELFNNGIEQFKNNPELKAQLIFGLATLTENGLNDCEKALELYNELIREFPNDMRFVASRAGLKNKLKDYDGAIADCDIVFNSGESDYEYLYVEKGNALSMLGQYKQAIEYFDNVIMVYPDIYPAYFGKGYALENLKKSKQALKCYDKAIEIWDGDYAPYFNKSGILYSLKKYDEALDFINKAIKLNPNYANAYALRAMISIEMKNISQTIKDIKRTQKLDKNNPHAYRLKAMIYYLKNEYLKALKEAKKAIEYDTNAQNRAEVHYLCYLIYKKLKQPQKALQEKNHTFKEDSEFKYRTYTKYLKQYSKIFKD